MKNLATLAIAFALSACSAVSETPDAPTFAIRNPAIYATQPTRLDDNGVPSAVVPGDASVVLPSAKNPFPWASGTRRVAD